MIWVMPPITRFTYEQWKWVKERYDEGYGIEALSRFLGVHPIAIRWTFTRLGFGPIRLPSDLAPLETRRDEFSELGVKK